MRRKTPPQKLCARINDEDQNRLRLHFADLATRAARKYGVKVFQVRSPSEFRSRAVCRAREEVVLGLRESVWYRDVPGTSTVTCTDGGEPVIRKVAVRLIEFGTGLTPYRMLEPPWNPISTMDIAALFPCNHSAIVLLLQRVERRRIDKERGGFNLTRRLSDDRNRDSDRNGVDSRGGDCGGSGQSGDKPAERTDDERAVPCAK